MSAALFKKAKQKALYLAILGMFSNNVPGLVLDSNDWGPTGTGGTGVVYSDGATPVTAMEQPVQIILDKSQGLARGADLVTPVANRTFTSDTGFWSKDSVTISGNAANWSGVPNGYALYRSAFLASGKTYIVTVTVSSVSAGGLRIYCPLSAVPLPTYTTPGTYTLIVPTTGLTSFGVISVGTTTASITYLSAVHLAGNHAYVSASANRPIITARVNRLIATENFASASWASTVGGTGVGGYTKTPNYNTAPDGTQTACRVQLTIGAGTTAGDYCGMYQNLGASYAGQTGTWWIKSNTTTAIIGFGASQKTITTAWQQFTITQALQYFQIAIGGNDGSTKTVDLSVWHPDCRDSDQATGLIPTYQRINTATDYDTVGFPVREAYNGSNQLLGGASGGGATTGFFFCAGVMITKVGAAQTLFSDTGTNTGWRVRINASNQLELSAGNGTTYTTVATVGTVSINKLTVVTAWHDGTNLNVQINQGAVAQAAFAVATAGTAGYTLGCDNGASTNYLQGSLGEIVYRTGTAMNAAQIATTQAFVNSKQKAY